MRKIKYLISDIDGCWTDGGIYYSNKGEELKKFCFADGGGVALLNHSNLKLIICTGETSTQVEKRMEKLKIRNFYGGVKNKLNFITEYFSSNSISLSDAAYLGDDINDYLIMKKVGYPICPSNACKSIQEISKYVLQNKGGNGAFREFVEYALTFNGEFDAVFNKYLISIS